MAGRHHRVRYGAVNPLYGVEEWKCSGSCRQWLPFDEISWTDARGNPATRSTPEAKPWCQDCVPTGDEDLPDADGAPATRPARRPA